MTDATLGASGLWLETLTGAGGTATLTESFFGLSPWLNGHRSFRLQVHDLTFHCRISRGKLVCHLLYKRSRTKMFKILKINFVVTLVGYPSNKVF